MSKWRQLRLLLWKDYLIRKRKMVTLTGVIWTLAVLSSLYIVRVNIENVDYPTCQFPARALPSAGMLNFLQSFVCTVNNECQPLDQFQEIPAYEKSKLSQLKREVTPLLYNETLLQLADLVPDSVKLLATLTDVVNGHIPTNGIRVDGLFTNPERVRRHLAKALSLSDDVTNAVMVAKINVQGVLKGHIDRCMPESISLVLNLNNKDYLNELASKLCTMKDEDIQKLFMDLIFEINFSKYIKMVGEMYTKLTGDRRLEKLSDTLTAVTRMSKLQSFMLPELTVLFQGREPEFAYFNATFISSFMDLFKPTFQDTAAFQSIYEFVDAAVTGLQFMSNVFKPQTTSDKYDKVPALIVGDVAEKHEHANLTVVAQTLNNALNVFDNVENDGSKFNVFEILTKATNFVLKWLDKETQYQILFYSTLLTKLIEGAQQVIAINMNIEEVTYEASLRNPEALQIFVNLPPSVIEQAFETLVDADRTQLVISKYATPGQIFCDANKLQYILRIKNKSEATALKNQLCTGVWKSYITDLVQSFGIVSVKDNINSMASLLIQNTIGKDTSKYLYTIDKDFKVLQNFTNTLYSAGKETKKNVDWLQLLNATNESAIMTIAQKKAHLGKQMLITVHGALAKDVVEQNLVLSYKLTPFFKDMNIMAAGINKQLEKIPAKTIAEVKAMYPAIVKTVLSTALNERKTLSSLCTNSKEIFCSGLENASLYLEFHAQESTRIVTTLCAASTAIEESLLEGSDLGRAINKIRNSTHSALDEVPWSELITNLKQLYTNLDANYTYLFDWGTYGMDRQEQVEIEMMVREAKALWFGKGSGQRSGRLSVHLLLRALDLVNSPAFNISTDTWMKVKYIFNAFNAPLEIADQVVRLISEVASNGDLTAVRLPEMTTLLLGDVLRHLPYLVVDTANIVVQDQTEIEPILTILNSSPAWPCSTITLANLLPFSDDARTSVQALERIMCFDELRMEWEQYFKDRNYSKTTFDWNKNNYTTKFYEPRVFLKFSRVFDDFIARIYTLKDTLNNVSMDESDEAHLSIGMAVQYTKQLFNKTNRDEVLSKFFHKFDNVLNSVHLESSDKPLYRIWELHRNCTEPMHTDCTNVTRALGGALLKFVSVVVGNVAGDLLTYFEESNDPNANILQRFGFTKNTGLYLLYDKLPDFVGVLLNSYFDFGFMNQVRRASRSRFWDCEALVSSLVPPAFSSITPQMLSQVQPYVCPSLLYWISLPRGDNVFLDLVAKPQYYFYTLPIKNLSSSFKESYSKGTKLSNLIYELSQTNKTVTRSTFQTLKDNLQNSLDNVFNFKINETNPTYKRFTEANKKEYAAILYLTKVITIVNKLADRIDNFNISNIQNLTNEESKTIEDDLSIIGKIFKRRPHEAIAFHFDVITDVLWENKENYDLVSGVESMCQRLTASNENKTIVDDSKRTRNQICSKMYAVIYGAVQDAMFESQDGDHATLLTLVRVLNPDADAEDDLYQILKENINLVETWKTSIKYAYDLGIPIYLKYLQMNVNHYRVVLSLTTGSDWWKELRSLYNGPIASSFLDFVEKSFDVAEDFLKGPDQVHLVRLLSDINVNNTDLLCQNNISISEYLPDSTGYLADINRQLCMEDSTDILKDIPPMVFASQGYNAELKLSKDINYNKLYSDVNATEEQLHLLLNGLKPPMTPSWITQERIDRLRNAALGLMSEESMTKVAFGALSNMVDAGTLFLNNSHCPLCSDLTKWFKQLNLQLFKKQEYDNLLCHINEMTLDELYSTLKNDFHWDMAIGELLSTRNYTKFELNKSINEFLDHVKLHLLEQLNKNHTKIADCLNTNVTRNTVGNITLLFTVLSKTTRMLRSQMPHLYSIPGIALSPYFQKLSTEIAHNLDVYKPVKEILNNNLDEKSLESLLDKEINMRMLQENRHGTVKFASLPALDTDDFCRKHDCDLLNEILSRAINWTLVDIELPTLQTTKFWKFEFVSTILSHIESLLNHAWRILGVASSVDLTSDRIDAMLDFVMQILTDDTFDSIIYSVQGITQELLPLLKNSPLVADLQSLPTGLTTIRDFKNYLIRDVDLKFPVSELFPNADAIEASLSALGVNHTNFWSVAAHRIKDGVMDFKPLLPTKQKPYSISSYACDPEVTKQVLFPSEAESVSIDDVIAATTEQFCDRGDAKKVFEIMPTLLGYFNYSIVVDQLSTTLLSKLYTAANLTLARGAAVVSRYQEVASLLPVVQQNIGDLGEDLAKEPLFQSLRNFSSIGGLLGSSKFLPEIGNLMCGSPFRSDVNRVYKAVVSSSDLADKPDQTQLDALPTDFCRSLYKDIISVEGGKIVWSFIKPLIMGKILYAPNTPAVNEIISKANSSFAHMIRITTLLHNFANSFPYVEDLSQRRDTLKAMTSLMTSLDLPGSVIDVDDVFEDFEGIKDMGALLQKASNILQCFNLNRFKAVRDEAQLTHEAAQLTLNNEFSNGLVFLKADVGGDGSAPDVEYKIRMDIENVPTTSRLKNYFWIPGPESNFLEDMRYFRGFVQIQDMIDKAVIEVASSRNRQKRDVHNEDVAPKYAIYTQQMPYPCYRKDYFQTSLYESQALVVAFFFSLLLTVCSAVRLVVHEKQTLNTMLMSIMGVEVHLISLSWLLSSLVEVLTSALLATALLKWGAILPRTDASVVFTLISLFGLSVLSFCYLISRFLSSAGVAAVVAGLAYLVTFMPFVIVLSLETTLTYIYRCLLCLSMSSSFCYAILFLTRFEAAGSTFSWAQFWDARFEGDTMSVGQAAGFLLLDSLIYTVLGLLWERFYGIKAIKSNITVHRTTADKAGVSIINVTKVYHKNSRNAKVALDNVSVELQRGKITTLLGHNGAGKTTLLKILTGMLKPTSGEVVVHGESGASRAGVCPQHDVLFDNLTPAEHVRLYESLSDCCGNGDGEKILNQLCLGDYADEPVSKLSGGTRRRLCVALAFVGNTDLVTLDEPTANVDPKARRDIWTLIGRLKEDKTILLTTHHMDEAELLSDQIVIMHKGQVHTTGSPIEIKRSLGNGYKLYVTYPERADLDEEDQLLDLEERTKNLLAVVRGVVKNASVVEIAGADVELLLPFYDEHGLHNDFLKLFQTLESNESLLGWNKLSVDCCTLEQVFYNICSGANEQSNQVHFEPDMPSKSGSSSSIKNDRGPLLAEDGPLAASPWQQLKAILHVQYLNYSRDHWQLFMLVVLPTLFVTIAMLFSLIRPPADNEIALHLTSDMYSATEFIVKHPSVSGDFKEDSINFAENVLQEIANSKNTRLWSSQDTPRCECTATRQVCYNTSATAAAPQMMALPDVDTLNDWLVKTQDQYIEKRYGGFTTAIKDNITNFIVWYNNKGHHSLPAFLSTINSAILKYKTGGKIRTYTHPLKITQEQLTKDNVYQHIADAGITCLLVVAACVAGGGAAAAAVRARRSRAGLLLSLRAVPPAVQRAGHIAPHVVVFAINTVIMAAILYAFGFDVFVYRMNLPATCLLFFMFGISCGSLGVLLERCWADAGLATMVLFCGNAFVALSGVTLLLILDIISESETTDAVRFWLHKILLVFPQFVLADGLLEIAKNTIKAQVLLRFGMDTYMNPLSSSLLGLHFASMLATTAAFIAVLLLMDYGVFQRIWIRFRPRPTLSPLGVESPDVVEERQRVTSKLQKTLRLNTLGNINAGFVDTESTTKSKKNGYRNTSCTEDILSCVDLTKVYPTMRGQKKAVDRLTIGVAPGQCTVLLGQNGAGKSTTFAMLTGEELPSAGAVYVNGERADTRTLHSGIISYCPQTNALDPLLTVRETLRFDCRLSAIENHNEAVSSLASWLGLAQHLDKPCGALSGGVARRVSAARALLPRAALTALDEPTSGMDPNSRTLLAATLRAYCARAESRRSRGVLVSTHAVNDLRATPHTVALMHQGRLQRLIVANRSGNGLSSGYIINLQVCGAAGAAWRRMRRVAAQVATRVASHVALRACHHRTLTLRVALTGDDGKENGIKLSDIFSLMATLQAHCDIEDYTINQTTLEEMFLSFKNDEYLNDNDGEEEKSPVADEDLEIVTSL